MLFGGGERVPVGGWLWGVSVCARTGAPGAAFALGVGWRLRVCLRAYGGCACGCVWVCVCACVLAGVVISSSPAPPAAPGPDPDPSPRVEFRL